MRLSTFAVVLLLAATTAAQTKTGAKTPASPANKTTTEKSKKMKYQEMLEKVDERINSLNKI